MKPRIFDTPGAPGKTPGKIFRSVFSEALSHLVISRMGVYLDKAYHPAPQPDSVTSALAPRRYYARAAALVHIRC